MNGFFKTYFYSQCGILFSYRNDSTVFTCLFVCLLLGSFYRLSGRLLIMSGKTGKVLTWVGVPDKHETYYSPQVYLQMDATPMVLFGTGGETHSGSLWVISVNDLVKNRMANVRLYLIIIYLYCLTFAFHQSIFIIFKYLK